MSAARVDCARLSAYADELLQVEQVRDWKNALNGLQVESRGTIAKLGAAVDASEETIRGAIERGCGMLLVHHGLFWSGNRPVTGARYRKLRMLFESDMALYSAHLPLDVHPELGNNILLARGLGLEPNGEFGEFEGRAIGVRGACDCAREELQERLATVVGGEVQLIPGGPARVRTAGVLTGGGGSMVQAAIGAGLDALITGEGSHHTYVDAMEGGLNLYYAGHYATETFGVRALAEHVAARFDLEWEFIDAPTGL